MQITHVIRAEEHLSNTPRQIFMIDGLGWKRPEYAHVPFVAEPGSKNKLSKRKIAQYLKNPDFKKVYEHGQAIAARIGMQTSAETFNPVIVDFYEQVGYINEAIINYLVLLGWSLDDKSEFFAREEMIKLFSLERVNKAPASFDAKKLFHFQEQYMVKLPVKFKAHMVRPYLQKAKLIPTPDSGNPQLESTEPLLARAFRILEPTPSPEIAAQVEAIVQAAGDRIKVAGDILEYDYFFMPDERFPYDESVFEKRMRKAPEAVALLRKFTEKLVATESFDAASLEKLMQDFLQAEGTEIGKIHHALRVALTGKGVSFGLFETLAILGKKHSLARIARALGRI
jgi:glutamyl-tRNA synthetase